MDKLPSQMTSFAHTSSFQLALITPLTLDTLPKLIVSHILTNCLLKMTFALMLKEVTPLLAD